jgi:CheY-like chemotaxis protein
MIRVLLCEDDPRVRLTLARAVESQSDLEVVASVGTGEEALAAAADADAIIMDVHLPGIDGIEVIRRLRANGLQTPVIILSADDRAAEDVPSFEGVSFLSKGSSGALKVLAEIRARAVHAG